MCIYVFICGLFTVTVGDSRCRSVARNNWVIMNNKMDRMCKEAVPAWSKFWGTSLAFSWRENDEKSVSPLKFEEPG
jgi:hypothetical protein